MNDNEFRYVNKTPSELRILIATETDPVELELLQQTLQVFQRKGWAAGDPNDPRATNAGEPYRGEPREVATPASIMAMTKDRKPVEHVFLGDSLRKDQIDPGVPNKETEMKDFSGMGMVQNAVGNWEEP